MPIYLQFAVERIRRGVGLTACCANDFIEPFACRNLAEKNFPDSFSGRFGI